MRRCGEGGEEGRIEWVRRWWRVPGSREGAREQGRGWIEGGSNAEEGRNG